MDALVFADVEVQLVKEYANEHDGETKEQIVQKLLQCLREQLRHFGAHRKTGRIPEGALERQEAILRELLSRSSGDWVADVNELLPERPYDLLILCSAEANRAMCDYTHRLFGGRPTDFRHDMIVRILATRRSAVIQRFIPGGSREAFDAYCGVMARNARFDADREQGALQPVHDIGNPAGQDPDPDPWNWISFLQRNSTPVHASDTDVKADLTLFVKRAWDELSERYKKALWLSATFQKSTRDDKKTHVAEAVQELKIESPIPPYQAGQDIDAATASRILELRSVNAFYTLKHRAESAFIEMLLIEMMEPREANDSLPVWNSRMLFGRAFSWAWKQLLPEDQRVLWLGPIFQKSRSHDKPRSLDQLLRDLRIASPIAPYEAGKDVSSGEAAKILGLPRADVFEVRKRQALQSLIRSFLEKLRWMEGEDDAGQTSVVVG